MTIAAKHVDGVTDSVDIAAKNAGKTRGALTVNQEPKVDALKQVSQTFATLLSFSA
ncbi:hypothetical protein [Agrobacterium sp. B1(2019)]|uniref:hypothetical protein n=1 Tax=Agrobacterium sp. B1(2019) TaxID=2607032 RepID=UPI001659F956|nr:hypothetical protein [Agrobacterium sp. B1(2019)]